MLQSLWTSTARDIHDNEKDQSLQLQQLDEMDYLCVALTGLCHDLGMPTIINYYALGPVACTNYYITSY